MIFVLLFMGTIGAFAAPANPINDFFRDKTRISNPFELRDPFKPPQAKSENKNQKDGYYISGKGQYSNIHDQHIQTIQDIRVVGVLIGKERRALVMAGEGNKEVIILKEGMKIGQVDAELKAILPGGIILVEKIINVYGQEEYLETVIPISK